MKTVRQTGSCCHWITSFRQYVGIRSRTSTAKELYNCVCKVFQQTLLLNKLRAGQDSYIVQIGVGEKLLSHINGMKLLNLILKSMNAVIDGKEMAMAI